MHGQERNKKRIDLQNNAQAEPEGTLRILRVKNIHSGCFCKPESCHLAQFRTWKQLQYVFPKASHPRPVFPVPKGSQITLESKDHASSLTLSMINDWLRSLAECNTWLSFVPGLIVVGKTGGSWRSESGNYSPLSFSHRGLVRVSQPHAEITWH